ncbi:hypothetical protein GQ457_04G031940 [Hibiscus cannabinus]
MNPSNSLPQTSPEPPSDGVDSSPFLTHSISDHLLRRRPPPLRGAAARLIRRASSQRLMLREPSVRVRETAAEQLEERQSDWAYSKPVIILDIVWNLAFVVMTAVVLGLSREEKPAVPLRLWVSGYGSRCLFHVACVIVECKIRNETRVPGLQTNSDSDSGLISQSGSETENSEDSETEELNSSDETRVSNSLESANTMFSFLWWIIGFYWLTAEGQALIHQSPQLYWLCVTFLALDVLFVFICVVVAGLIGLAVCCCLPCILAILNTLTGPDGAADEEIDRLPKYKFRRIGDLGEVDAETQESHEGIMTECNCDTPSQRILPLQEAAFYGCWFFHAYEYKWSPSVLGNAASASVLMKTGRNCGNFLDITISIATV